MHPAVENKNPECGKCCADSNKENGTGMCPARHPAEAKNMMPRKTASRKRAVIISQARSGPAIFPIDSMNPGQLVPNWKDMVIAAITPSAKERAKMLTQMK